MGTQVDCGENSFWSSLDLSKNGSSLLNKLLLKAARTASSPIDLTSMVRKEEKRYVYHPDAISYFILRERSNCLPEESQIEMKKYNLDYSRLNLFIRERKEVNEKILRTLSNDNLSHKEDRQQDLLKIWRQNILPNWRTGYPPKKIRQYFWEGIPSPIRGQVWSLLLIDKLGITRELFDACLSESRRHLESDGINQRCASADYTTQKSPAFTTNNIFFNSSFDLTNLKTDSTSCKGCNFIFRKLNTVPIKREYTRASAMNYSTFSSNSISLMRMPRCDRRSSTNPLIMSSGSSNLDSLEFGSLSLTDRVISPRGVKSDDICRTFPDLRLFQFGNPYHEKLHDLLATYITYKPEVGYVPGMSLLAGMLLIVFDNVYDAFVIFANILARPCHQAFYSLNEEQFLVYVNAFDKLFAEYLPHLYAHIKAVGLETNMFLFDWFFTIFSGTLPLETAMRLWDLYFIYEESALFYAALAILKLFEKDLLLCSFNELFSFLTDMTLPNALTPEVLITTMYSFHHHQQQQHHHSTKRHTIASSRIKTSRQHISSQESLFSMHQLLSVFKDDLSESLNKFSSSTNTNNNNNLYTSQISFNELPRPYHHLDHSARSPREISDESDGAVDIDDQYFNFNTKELSYHWELTKRSSNNSNNNSSGSMDRMIIRELHNVTNNNNNNSNLNKGIHKTNTSEVKKRRCTNPCFSYHLTRLSSSSSSTPENKLSGGTHSYKSQSADYSQRIMNDDASTFKPVVGNSNLQESRTTSSEMIP